MENTESRLQNVLQSIQDWTNRQTDPTNYPYVKDKSFYDNIANTPLENTKLASYRQTLANMELLRMANRGLPMTRERMLPIVQGLIKGEAEVAEQDANIRNEQTRRNLVSHVMQNISDVKNPGEYMGIMKLLEASGGNKYNPAEMAYSFTTKDHANNNQLKGASTLAGIFGNLYSQEQQMAMQREQMAQQARLANMRLAAGGYGGKSSGGLVEFNPKDAIAANKAIYELFQLAADAKQPEERKKYMDEAGRLVDLYGALDPRMNPKTGNNQIIDDLKNQIKYFYAVEEQERAKNPSWEDIISGKYSSGNKLFDEMVRDIRKPYPIEAT